MKKKNKNVSHQKSAMFSVGLMDECFKLRRSWATNTFNIHNFEF